MFRAFFLPLNFFQIIGILYTGEDSNIKKLNRIFLLVIFSFVFVYPAVSSDWKFSRVELNDDVLGRYLVYYDKASIKSYKDYGKIWVKKIYEKKQRINDNKNYNISEELIVFNCTNKTWTKVKWTLMDLRMNVVEESEVYNPFKPEWNTMWGGVPPRTLTHDLYNNVCKQKTVKK